MSIVGVILAADAGEDFPSSKYLSDVGGTPLLERTVRSASEWPVDEVIVVLGADAEILEESVDLGGVSVLVDPSWAEGTAAPLRAVMDLLSRSRDVTHVIVARGDQPEVRTSDVERLVAAARADGVSAVVPKYRYAVGYPVVIGRAVWDVFLRLEGEIDALDILTSHGATIEEVWFDHVAPRRILVPDDLPGRRR